jgi:hypothetical protein
MMAMIYSYFAHNGINHATEAEASSHQSNALLWIIAITLITAAAMFFIIRFLDKQERGDKEDK